VFIHVEQKDGRLTYYFDVPPESPTVRGFASFLSQGINGSTPAEVAAIPEAFYLETGLNQVLSPQRLNGLSAILAYMKRLALQL
jgi:cysteine desulfuration protein SufE